MYSAKNQCSSLLNKKRKSLKVAFLLIINIKDGSKVESLLRLITETWKMEFVEFKRYNTGNLLIASEDMRITLLLL